MTKFIALNMIRSEEATYPDGDEGVAVMVEQTVPVQVNTDFIRCFYPRNDGKVGTRLTFDNATGFAVTETHEAVTALIAA